MGRRWQWGLVVVLAMGWWTAVTLQARGTVFSRVPLLDERFYLEAAAEPVAADQPFFMSPLYPHLIGALGAGLGPDTVVLPTGGRGLVPWFQGLLWLGAALLLRGCANRLLPEARSGWRWLPTLLFLLYGPLLIYGQMALVEMPLVFLTTLVLYILTGPRRIWPWVLTLGLAVGLAALLRGSLLVLALPVMIRLCQGGAWRARAVGAAVFLGTLALVLMPAVWHNSRLAGHLTGPTTNGGINLYLGNGPEATGLGAGFSVDWQEDPAGLQQLSRRLGRQVHDPLEADGLWAGQARQAMIRDPLRTLGLWLRKGHFQWQGWEMDQIAPLAGWRQEVPWLRLGLLPWSLLVILAGAGLAAAGKRLILPAGLLLLLMAVQSLFFVVSRYRMVLVPALCLLALGGLLTLVQGSGKRRRRALLGLVAAMVLAWPWQLGEARARWSSLALANHAQRWALLAQEEGRFGAWQRAADLYGQALEGRPTQPGPWLGAAAAFQALGETNRATRVLEEGRRVLPEETSLQRNLLSLYLQTGQTEPATGVARSLLQAHPRDPVVLHNLIVLLAGEGQQEEASNLARRLIRVAPDSGQGYLDLGVLLARSGRKEEAAAVFRQGVKAVPGDDRLRENLHRLEGES